MAATSEKPVTGRPLPANQRCRGSHSRSSGASERQQSGASRRAGGDGGRGARGEAAVRHGVASFPRGHDICAECPDAAAVDGAVGDPRRVRVPGTGSGRAQETAVRRGEVPAARSVRGGSCGARMLERWYPAVR